MIIKSGENCKHKFTYNQNNLVSNFAQETEGGESSSRINNTDFSKFTPYASKDRQAAEAINSRNFFPLTPCLSLRGYRTRIDKLKLNVQDTNLTMLNSLDQKYSIHLVDGLVHNFSDQNADEKVKVSYTRYRARKKYGGKKVINPWATIEIHDVTLADQLYLLELLAGKKYSLTIVELALDLFPENDNWFDLMKFLWCWSILEVKHLTIMTRQYIL